MGGGHEPRPSGAGCGHFSGGVGGGIRGDALQTRIPAGGCMTRRVSFLLLFLLILAAALTLRLSRYDYAMQDRNAIMAPSTAQHSTGTDELGRDRTVRVAAALLIGLAGAAVAAAITTIIAA